MRNLRRVPKEQRKTNNVLLLLNERERDALDKHVDRFRIDNQTFLRTLIIAVDEGKIPSSLFDR